jgi:hypothetical protein
MIAKKKINSCVVANSINEHFKTRIFHCGRMTTKQHKKKSTNFVANFVFLTRESTQNENLNDFLGR